MLQKSIYPAKQGHTPRNRHLGNISPEKGKSQKHTQHLLPLNSPEKNRRVHQHATDGYTSKAWKKVFEKTKGGGYRGEGFQKWRVCLPSM